MASSILQVLEKPRSIRFCEWGNFTTSSSLGSAQGFRPYNVSAQRYSDIRSYPVKYIGNAILNAAIAALPLNDVLIVPEIKKNLLSVSKFTDDYPCSFIFDKTGVYLKDSTTNTTMKLGRKVRGLYRVEPHAAEAYFTQRQRIVAESIWHQRLAHTNQSILKQLKAQNLIQYNKESHSVCRSCQIAKSTALPFPLSNFTATKPLQQIHCDIWGPSPVKSFQSFKYYVIFVDNFSRFSWIYPLKLKSEFYSIFLMFQKLVENQHNCKIQTFQCDGGGEFISQKIQNSLTELWHSTAYILSIYT